MRQRNGGETADVKRETRHRHKDAFAFVSPFTSHVFPLLGGETANGRRETKQQRKDRFVSPFTSYVLPLLGC